MQNNSFYFSQIRKISFSLLILFSLFISGCGLHPPETNINEISSCISQGWPQDTSDLVADPELIFGTLDNGLRYVIKQNHEPKDRVALYLNIQAGSLHETEEQRGLAHYLEHMLFNGTTHYPPGTLIEYFQSIGMSFGADTNAHTSYDETVYKLLLPSGSPETLDEGMLVLADYARGALLLEKEVDRERGIILAEKRTRDTAASRVSKKSLEYEFSGTLVAKRDPIGTDKTLQTADSKLLRSFYDTWYRPENMIVVLVGDTDPEQAISSIRHYFSGLQAATEKPVCFDFGRVQEESGTDVFYQFEPDLGVTKIGVSAVWNVEPQPDTAAWEKIQLQNYVAASLLDNRLQHHVNAKNSPLSKARVYAGTFVQRLGYCGLNASVVKDQWQQGLSLLEQTLRQALEHGIISSELERVKREILAELEKDVQTAKSRVSSKLASDIIKDINDNEVFLSPSQELELYGNLLAEMSVADVEEALQRIWKDKRYLIEVAGTTDLQAANLSAEQQILQVWTSSQAIPVDTWQQESEVEFPYLPMVEDPSPIQKVISHQDIDATTTVLANGLRINVKKTDFKDQEVLLEVHFGNGQLSEPAPGLGKLATAVLRESGLGRMTREQLDAALAGRNGRVNFSVDSESFVFSGKGLSSELELMLQLVYTNLVDPAFRGEAYKRSMERFAQMYTAMQNSVEGTYQLQGDRFFAGDNSRYGFPDKSAFMQLRLDQVRLWLEDAFAQGQLEVSVVGDVDPEQVIDLVRKYLGGHGGDAAVVAQSEDVIFPVGQQKIVSVTTEADKAMVVVGWPTDDFWDISRTRRLSVLASVLEDRLRRTIREELGATYSPTAYNLSSRVDRGYGILRCLLTVDPLQVDQVNEKIGSIAGELVRQGVSTDELQRIIAPINTSIKDLQRTNRYWLTSVLALSSRHPEQLQWPMSIRADFASISREEINDFAVRYLRAGHAASLIVLPKQ